ncbi:MAG: hypothetical protein AAGJ80_15210, partial [Cyanobacteria bacterium J06553_1]
ARRPANARQLVDVEIDDADIELWSKDDSFISLSQASPNGRFRDYEMKASNEVYDVDRWLSTEEALVRCVFERMDEFLVRGRLVLKAFFVKRNPATLQVLRREMFYVSSLPADFIHDFHQWYSSHTIGIINHLESFEQRDSNLEFDGIEALDIKFSLLDKLSGRGFFKLPDALKQKQAVINVDCKDSCFKYALLSILHYGDVNINRHRVSKYECWRGELNFGEVDASDVYVQRDVPKIEQLNNIKINIHVWEKGLQGCVYNNRRALGDKTVNLLLVVGSEGERHYCGIPSLSRLYYHTKDNNCMQHMCERCIRSFKTKERLEEHFQWCARGRLQIEQQPKFSTLSYNALHKELSPVKVIYSDIESYIDENTHFPAAIASYEVWHPHIATHR